MANLSWEDYDSFKNLRLMDAYRDIKGALYLISGTKDEVFNIDLDEVKCRKVLGPWLKDYIRIEGAGHNYNNYE